MSSRSEATDFLSKLGLKEYETIALEELLSLGRTTAPNLAESTGIPKARIYGVLESLAESGYIKIIPGRPKEYQPKSPEEILEKAIENERQDYEQYREDINQMKDEFISTFKPQYERASQEITATEELFYVVDVGAPSERETRSLYHEANNQVHVLTKGFEYFDSVEPAFKNAIKRDVSVNILFLRPSRLSEKERTIQSDIIDRIRQKYPSIGMRFSDDVLPWRGTFIDPSMDYETGKAILLVEEKEISLSMQQAAITENGSFVAGLKRYFDLIWKYESTNTLS